MEKEKYFEALKKEWYEYLSKCEYLEDKYTCFGYDVDDGYFFITVEDINFNIPKEVSDFIEKLENSEMACYISYASEE